MQLKAWLPNEYGIFFTYYVQHFDSTISTTDTTKNMEINTTMVMSVSRKSNLQEFKFEGFEGFISLGKFLFFFKSKFIESSSVSAGKPVKGHTIKDKTLVVNPLPIISTAFWESVLIHYHSQNTPGVVLDLVPGNFFFFIFLNYQGHPTILLASVMTGYPYFVISNPFGSKGKYSFFFMYLFLLQTKM